MSDEDWDVITLGIQLVILLVLVGFLTVAYVLRSEGRAVPRACVDGLECWPNISGDPQLDVCFPSVRCEAEALPPGGPP